MRNFLATVLSVIAVGVVLIAYGLLAPRMAASDAYPYARPFVASQPAGAIQDLTPPAAFVRPVAVRVTRSAAPRRVVRSPRRDWANTAMVIGGTTAAGAGLGAIFGGKKGALIGAAIGGGAGTLFEVGKQ